MSQISIKKTDTPETPPAGWVAIYVNAADVPFLKKPDGTSVSFVGAPQFKAAEIRENNTVLFDQNYIIGNLAPRSGNVLFDFTNAQIGAWTHILHQDAGAWVFDDAAGTIDIQLNFDVTKISASAVNKFLCQLTDKTPGAEVVDIFHALEGGIS